jgi:NAD(P)-dependent dehydrogenase (short-subunit alcohol dehydrogenase family)
MSEIQRVAIVTGAAGGIGRAMTSGLLAAGIRVAGVDRDREPLEALAVSAREQGKVAELLTSAPGSWRDPAGESPAQVRCSARLVVSVAPWKATTTAKRTQQSCGVGY